MADDKYSSLRALDAGADLVMTQPIYAVEQWERFMDRAAARFGDRLPNPVLLGVLPLHSTRHAEFLHHEVPGITIPDPVRASMAAAGERGGEVGAELAMALLFAGQNATITGTLAGQIVMEGFLSIRLRPWLRRLVTRLIAVRKHGESS